MLSVALALMIAFSALSAGVLSVSATETEYVEGYYTYTVLDGGKAAIVAADAALNGNITLPSELGGYTVECIGSDALVNCINVTGITVPESIDEFAADLAHMDELSFLSLSTATDYSLMELSYKRVPSDVIFEGGKLTVKWTSGDSTTTLTVGADVTDDISVPGAVEFTIDSIKLASENTAYKLIDGVLYDYDVTKLIVYPILSSATSYVMPDTVIADGRGGVENTLFFAENLKSVTIGANYNIGFGDVETYREYYNEFIAEAAAEGYGKEIVLFFMSQLIMQLGDGASGNAMFLLSENLEEINVSPNHAYLTSKDGVLCLKDDDYDVVITYPGSKECPITLGSNDIVYTYAFISLQSRELFVITDGFCDTMAKIAALAYPDAENNEAFYTYMNNFLSYVPAKKFSASASNPYYSTDANGILYNKDKTKLIKYPPRTSDEMYVLPNGVAIEGTAFFSFTPLTFEVYYPSELTVHISNLENPELTGFPMCKKVCTDTPEETVIDVTEEGESLTLGEFVEEYNSLMKEAIAKYDEMVKEVEQELKDSGLDGTVAGEYELEIFKNLMLLFCGYLPLYPEIAFCDGNHGAGVIEMPEPEIDEEVVKTPTQFEINYGDSIILHVDPAKIPEGGYVEWKADNGNFTMSVSEDGTTCTVSPKSSGDTKFTVTVYDANGNSVYSDKQEMTSNAGFFRRLVALFKKIFGLNKTIPQAIAEMI